MMGKTRTNNARVALRIRPAILSFLFELNATNSNFESKNSNRGFYRLFCRNRGRMVPSNDRTGKVRYADYLHRTDTEWINQIHDQK